MQHICKESTVLEVDGTIYKITEFHTAGISFEWPDNQWINVTLYDVMNRINLNQMNLQIGKK